MKSPLDKLNFKYLSGIKPTGTLTLGNYLGVIKPAVQLSKNENILMFIADMHAFTVMQNSENVKKHTLELVKIFNMYNLNFFIQSHIPEHNQLGYIMEYLAKDWELRNQIQYKENTDKSKRASLLTYPALMAADMLMYDIDNILVGDDQLSHIYLMNDLIKSFEREFSKDIMNKPKPYVGNFPKIKDLKDPDKKMSKSIGEKGCIFLFDKPQDGFDKIMGALTDNYNVVMYDTETKPGISNLINIYSGLTDLTVKEIELKYETVPFPYGTFKSDLAMIVYNFLVEFQENYKMSSNKFDEKLEKILKNKAESTLYEIMNAMGLKYENN